MNQVIFIDPSELGVIGVEIARNLDSPRQSDRSKAFNAIKWTLAGAKLLPIGARVQALGLGANCNGKRTLVVVFEPSVSDAKPGTVQPYLGDSQ